MRFLLGMLAGLILFPLGIYCYIAFGHPPVAATDAPFPLERKLTHIPLRRRIAREMPATVPLEATAENLSAGAGIYEDKCEVCHGTADQPSGMGRAMFPAAPQLWRRRPSGVVGVSDDPAGETYWKIKNGIRLTGMPAYTKILTEQQIWQVAILLSRANQPLPADVSRTVGMTH